MAKTIGGLRNLTSSSANTSSKYTEEQVKKANKIAETSKLPMDKILELVQKQDLRNAPKQMSKKDLQKQTIRNSTKKVTETHYEILMRGAKNNLPSSMR